MITQSEIAKLLGISRTTVARALNGDSNIKKETKEQVLTLAKDLNYQKNYIGSSLATKSNKNIAAIFLKSSNEEYFNQLSKGLNDFKNEISKFNINFKIFGVNINEHEKQLDILKKILSKNYDGIIIIPLDEKSIESTLKDYNKKIKVVSISKKLEYADIFIDSNYEKSGRIAAEILRHVTPKEKKILVIKSDGDLISSEKYLNGFLEKSIESNINFLGPIEVINIKDNKQEILKYLSPEIGGIYINRFATDIIEYLDEYKNLDFKFVTNGLNEKIKNLILNEKIIATISENFYTQGYMAGKKMFELLYPVTSEQSRDYKNQISILFKENITLP